MDSGVRLVLRRVALGALFAGGGYLLLQHLLAPGPVTPPRGQLEQALHRALEPGGERPLARALRGLSGAGEARAMLAGGPAPMDTGGAGEPGRARTAAAGGGGGEPGSPAVPELRGADPSLERPLVGSSPLDAGVPEEGTAARDLRRFATEGIGLATRSLPGAVAPAAAQSSPALGVAGALPGVVALALVAGEAYETGGLPGVADRGLELGVLGLDAGVGLAALLGAEFATPVVGWAAAALTAVYYGVRAPVSYHRERAYGRGRIRALIDVHRAGLAAGDSR